jgi:hypothetical protein
MNIKQATGYTIAQVRAMSTADYNRVQDELEDGNHHTAVAMMLAARNNNAKIVRCLEVLDDLHAAYGSMPYAAIQLRSALCNEVKNRIPAA